MKTVKKHLKAYVKIPLRDYVKLQLKMQSDLSCEGKSENITEGRQSARQMEKYNTLRAIFADPSILK
jgi:hypothetical protein